MTANDVELHYEQAGEGDPLVLVHGSWSDLHDWDAVAPALARSYRVVALDRRGHGRSERPLDQGTRRDQEDDVAALIEGLGRGPAHVVGTSFGGAIAIGLATRRPELVRSVVAHEPPLLPLVADDPELQPIVEPVQAAMQAGLERIARGDVEAGARQFVEEIALGPGSWEPLPEPIRATMVDTAQTFLAEMGDPGWGSLDLQAVAGLEPPFLLTQGDASPEWFLPIVARLAEIAGDATLRTYRGAGHAPHLTHPADYLTAVTDFLASVPEPALVR